MLTRAVSATVTTPQIKCDDSIVRYRLRKVRTEITVEILVVVQPPKSRPCNDQVLHASVARRAKAGDRLRIIRRRSPIFSFTVNERQCAAAFRFDQVARAPSAIVDEDERLACADNR